MAQATLPSAGSCSDKAHWNGTTTGPVISYRFNRRSGRPWQMIAQIAEVDLADFTGKGVKFGHAFAKDTKKWYVISLDNM